MPKPGPKKVEPEVAASRRAVARQEVITEVARTTGWPTKAVRHEINRRGGKK